MHKLDHEVEVNRALHTKKEGLDQKLSKSTAQNQKLMEEVARLKEDVKRYEGRKRYFEEKVSRLEFGQIINQKMINAVMKGFFNSEAWRNAQINNFISSGNIHATLSENFSYLYS